MRFERLKEVSCLHSQNIIEAIQVVSKRLNQFADNPVNDPGQVLTVAGYKTVKLRLPVTRSKWYHYRNGLRGKSYKIAIII